MLPLIILGKVKMSTRTIVYDAFISRRYKFKSIMVYMANNVSQHSYKLARRFIRAIAHKALIKASFKVSN
jgi:hypothetical protein